MLRRPLASVIAAGIFISASSSWAAELQLNGSAIYSHLTRDYYQAALYLERKDDSAETVRLSTAAKQMRLVVTNRWKPRKWKKLWQANISINNETLPNNPASREALMAFIRLPKDELQPGDEITISSSSAGTKVHLNKELAIHTSDRSLFRYLLNTWIGKFPPSREFRSQILSTSADSSLEQQLQQHQIPKQRLKLLSTWREKERQQNLEKQQRRQQQQQLLLQAKESERKKQQALLAQQKAIAEKQAAERKRQQQLVAERAAQEKLKQQAAAQAAQRQAAQKQAVADKRQQKQQSAAERKRIATEQQGYYLALYQWQLQQALEQEVRYPPWAKQFGQQGDVLLTMTFNKNGEIVSSEQQATEQHELLKEEVERASRIISSQVNPPDMLSGSPWTYTLGYRFSLDGEPQPAQAKPELPQSLRGKTEAVDKAAQLTLYKQKVREKILSELVYPKSARILKKQGEVSFDIELNASGELTDLTKTVSNRHRELNKALKKAIQGAAPFGAVPGGKAISIPVSYQFKQ